MVAIISNVEMLNFLLLQDCMPLKYLFKVIISLINPVSDLHVITPSELIITIGIVLLSVVCGRL